MFCASITQYMQKIDMSIGIVCMVNKTAIKLNSPPKSAFKDFDSVIGNKSDDKCFFQPKNNTVVTLIFKKNILISTIQHALR